jgi:methyl-accepting chemotaxis protein
MKGTSERISVIQAELVKLVSSETGKQMLADANAKRDLYVSARTKAFAPGADEAASMAALSSTMEAYAGAIGKLATHQRQKADHDAAAVIAQGDSGQNKLVGLWLAAFAIAVAFTVLLTRSITQPLRAAIDVTEAVARGQLDCTEQPIRATKPAQLLAALTQLTRSRPTFSLPKCVNWSCFSVTFRDAQKLLVA